MKYLVFDTETSGLPKTREIPNEYNISNFPYIIQLSYIIYDSNEKTICKIFNKLIKIKKNIITHESYKIHNISYANCVNDGILINDALLEFTDDYNNCDLIIGHNINFDLKMINVENIRNLIPIIDLNNKNKHYCTMINSTNIIKIEKTNYSGQKYYKYPKLIEIYKYLFNSEPKKLHDAFVDILCCFRVFHTLYFNDDIYLNNNNFKELFLKNQ